MSTVLAAPAPYAQFQTRGGTYVADAFGMVIGASGTDVIDLLGAGCVLQSVKNNLGASTDPAAANDLTQDFSAGSRWVNNTTGLIWECASPTRGAAVWMPVNQRFTGRLVGANMNTTADQAIPLFLPQTAPFRVSKITARNASISLTAAVGGIYTAASKGGTALVAATQAYSSLTTAASALDLTLAATPSNTVFAPGTALYLSLSTAQGTAATADVFLFGDCFV
ncbi:MAG: hypothetical protein JO038_01365 [Alphaproteobacteria bacterium]|nr:hypothetical protein [Alphaproteobacteria bacterium]